MAPSDAPLLMTSSSPGDHLLGPPQAVSWISIGWGCVNLFATTVGAGILSVPICFAYCGSFLLALLILIGYGALSAGSLCFIFAAAQHTNARSYLELGGLCFGNVGSAAVLWSLLGLLGALPF